MHKISIRRTYQLSASLCKVSVCYHQRL